MNDSQNNFARTRASRRHSAADPGATANLSAARFVVADGGAPRAAAKSDHRRARAERTGAAESSRGRAERTPAPGRAKDGRSTRTARTNFMKYASDNRFVRTVYAFITGPWRFAFYAAVVIIAAVSIYLPVRDWYVAYRSGDILTRQLAIREAYNESLQADVDKLLSVSGIEETARESLGLVMPGEQSINVVGLEEDATDESDASDDTDASTDKDAASDDEADETDDADATDEDDEDATPTTSAEVAAAEAAVVEDSPWYIKMLDRIFFFEGVDGQTIVSSGA